MSVIFSDGWNDHTTNTQKWTTGAGVISGSSARTGSGGYQLSSSTTKQVDHVADEHATFIWGMAARRGVNGTIEMRFLSDSLATTHVTVQITTSGEIKVFRGTIGGTQLGSTTDANLVPASVFTYIEAKVTLSDTVGVVTVRVNGVEEFTISSADTKNAGTKTVLDGIGMATVAFSADIDDLVLMNGAGSTNNDFIGDVAIETIYPTSAGTTTGLTPSAGSNWQNVDDVPPNTTDYNSSATDELYDTYNLGSLVRTVGTIYAINIYAYAAKSDSGTKGGAIMLRSGGTDYEKTDVALATSFDYQNDIIEVDPATSVAWTIANVNALEAGFKVKAS